MQYLRTLLIGSLLVITTGCANGLNSVQKAELDAYEARGMAIQEKSPGAGAALGLLPGGGSFYGREYGFGVANLLLWPLSILWDPISGYDAARAINYNVTKAHVAKLQADFSDTADIQYRARQLTEDVALALQAKLLLEAGNSVVSDAFIASRLGGQGGRVYGTLPRGVNVEALVARSTPHLI